MQKDTIDELFDNLKGEFDINEPDQGHKNRFLEKLNANDVAIIQPEKKSGFNWKPFLAIAASLVICFSVITKVNSQPEVMDLASVSPEMAETQDFFTATIENELRKLNNESSPLTEKIVTDALQQIASLEQDYNQLKIDLTENGNDQRIIYAMISNFQNRIDILNIVIEEIEKIKQLINNNDDTKNTI
ncbi:hypothetical protein [uncultured Winogradskyella sp.]|uniref:hypothetical protein n=1 Tax=uncultured Winogradskyella sp. TaxID=395353 RepID=UPI002619AA23|nr:hypothetical protein [uncultured Winogradskyella sp.]